ncbi:hypothetical protein [[Ruminococcus] torques]
MERDRGGTIDTGNKIGQRKGGKQYDMGVRFTIVKVVKRTLNF